MDVIHHSVIPRREKRRNIRGRKDTRGELKHSPKKSLELYCGEVITREPRTVKDHW